MKIQTLAIAIGLAAATSPLHAQVDFKIADRPVQVHSFGSQGFLYTNQNNYMAMPTGKGSFAFTDGGANISSQITDKFRVGAQVYVRNMGEFGNWHPELDWAYGSYRFNNWLGVRAGKVKSALGLYNDVQDMDSLHTFALLPQGIYPVDWRSTTIAHTGGDLFGDVEVKHLGTFSYVGYIGAQPHDLRSGYDYAAASVGTIYDYRGGREIGGDLRWTLPFGAVVGASYLDSDLTGRGTVTTAGVTTPYKQTTTLNGLSQFYGQYTLKRFRVDTEYRKNLRDVNLYRTETPSKSIADSRAWYVAGSYHVAKSLDLGAYRSIYYVDTRKDTSPATAHEFDTTLSARVNLTNHIYVKCEAHFIDGAATTVPAARGFYSLSNPDGIKPTTNLFMIRTGFSF